MRVTNIIQHKHNKLRIPTGGRLTSWLFTRRGGVEFGANEDKSIQWQGGGFEPGISGLQVQRPTTRPRSPPFLLPSRKNARSQVTQRCVRGLFTSNLRLRRITPSLICTAIISYLALSNNCQLHNVEFKTAQAKSLDFWLIYSNQSGLISVVQVYDTSIHH